MMEQDLVYKEYTVYKSFLIYKNESRNQVVFQESLCSGLPGPAAMLMSVLHFNMSVYGYFA